MDAKDFTIGQEVVRTTTCPEVGRTGTILEINVDTNRVRVAWYYNRPRTWVKATEVAPTSIPYEIAEIPITRGLFKGAHKQVYRRL